MIGNVIDRRESKYSRLCDIIVEPSHNDNSLMPVAERFNNQVDTNKDYFFYKEYKAVEIDDVLEEMIKLSFHVTVYLYDTAISETLVEN